MSNYTKENLLNIEPSNVPAGTLLMKVGNEIFTAGSVEIGTDVSATTATASDVLTGKQFYDAVGTLTQGTLVLQSGVDGKFDINSELDIMNNDLMSLNGEYFSVDNIESINDINLELNAINSKLLNIIGE